MRSRTALEELTRSGGGNARRCSVPAEIGDAEEAVVRLPGFLGCSQIGIAGRHFPAADHA